MSKLTKLEEVALAILIATKDKNTLNSCFKQAQEFLECSERQFKNCDFNKPNLNEIEVIGKEIEVKEFNAFSKTISVVNITSCLEETERELKQKRVLSPVHAMEIVSVNLIKMASEKVKEAQGQQFNV